MTPDRCDFLSDNVAGMCPEALAAIVSANEGFSPGYGRDCVTRTAAEAIRSWLGCDAEVRFVSTGTVANALACALLCDPHQAVLAHEHAHILTSEAGAPGFFGRGLAVQGVGGVSGRIDPARLAEAATAGAVASRQAPAALSLTNATEYGTVYASAAFAELCGTAKRAGLGVHLDGARLANAVAAGFDPREIVEAGVDVLVLGGSKAGAPVSEAIVILNRALARGIDTRLKQAGQLVSKTRFLAAPWIGLLEAETGQDPPWITNARRANAMAKLLAGALPFPTTHPVETNCVFVEMDAEQHRRLQAQGWRVNRVKDGSVRFVCSWATSEAAIDVLSRDVARLEASGG